VVFVLCGLWHGAAWVFIAWGLYHGAFLGLERSGLGRWLAGPGRSVRRPYTLLVVMGGWVVFRSETLAQAGSFYRAMAGFGASGGSLSAAGLLDAELFAALAWGVVFALPVLPWLLRKKDALVGGAGVPVRAVYGGGKLVVLMAILTAATLSVAAGSYNPFIYFRF
jgi:alginate O-acetyltransferase complex protein AlgI